MRSHASFLARFPPDLPTGANACLQEVSEERCVMRKRLFACVNVVGQVGMHFGFVLAASAIAVAVLARSASASTISVSAATFEVTAAGGIPISHPGTVTGSGCT